MAVAARSIEYQNIPGSCYHFISMFESTHPYMQFMVLRSSQAVSIAPYYSSTSAKQMGALVNHKLKILEKAKSAFNHCAVLLSSTPAENANRYVAPEVKVSIEARRKPKQPRSPKASDFCTQRFVTQDLVL